MHTSNNRIADILHYCSFFDLFIWYAGEQECPSLCGGGKPSKSGTILEDLVSAGDAQFIGACTLFQFLDL